MTNYTITIYVRVETSGTDPVEPIVKEIEEYINSMDRGTLNIVDIIDMHTEKDEDSE